MSSCELEYRTLSSTILEIKNLCNLFRELEVRFEDSPIIYYDNKLAIFMVEIPTTTPRWLGRDVLKFFIII